MAATKWRLSQLRSGCEFKRWEIGPSRHRTSPRAGHPSGFAAHACGDLHWWLQQVEAVGDWTAKAVVAGHL
jgi:hypothetical protein